MGINTDIQWCDSTVNPTQNCDGCELWTPGVRLCYAGRMSERFRGKGAFDQPIALFPGRMSAAALWPALGGIDRPKKDWIPASLPRLIFVSDMSDALSRAVSFDYLEQEIIATATSKAGKQHVWIWLTKRPQRMAEFSRWLCVRGGRWPRNVWAVTSVTNDKTAVARIPWLLQVGDDETVRGISAEPIWGQINLGRIESMVRVHPKIARSPWLDWIIVGGQSGRNTDGGTFERIADLAGQAEDMEIPCFVKQMGQDPAWSDPKGGDWDEWPTLVQVRQFPEFKL